MEPETLKSLMRAAAEQVIASAPELTALDQAIDDGDHGANMKRGFEAVLGKLDSITTQPLDEAFKTIGKTLVMTVGGASGPLYGSFFLAVGDALRSKRLPDDLADIFGSGVGAVSARGRSQAGEKTMLDVLFPVLETLKAEASHLDLIKRVRATASEAVARGEAGPRFSVRAVSGISIPARDQAASCCMPSATPCRRSNERHGRNRHRVAFERHR